jgi:hypothetical protein
MQTPRINHCAQENSDAPQDPVVDTNQGFRRSFGKMSRMQQEQARKEIQDKTVSIKQFQRTAHSINL